MECDNWAALLALLGLGAELTAIILVAWKFRPRRPPSHQRLDLESLVHTRAIMSPEVIRGGSEDDPGPNPSGDELRAKMIALRKKIDLNRQVAEDRLDRELQELRNEMIETTERTTIEAVRRDEEIRELVTEQTREALAEQKREAGLFGVRRRAPDRLGGDPARRVLARACREPGAGGGGAVLDDLIWRPLDRPHAWNSRQMSFPVQLPVQ